MTLGLQICGVWTTVLTLLIALAATPEAATQSVKSSVPNNDFVHQVILTVLDKGIIAIALAYVGFRITQAVERFKSEQSLRSALTQRQLDNVAEVWKCAASWEADVDAVISRYQEARESSPNGDLDDLANTFKRNVAELVAEGDALRNIARQNRFWTGEEIYQFFTDRQKETRGKLDSLDARNERALVEFQNHLEEERVKASRVLRRFIAENRVNGEEKRPSASRAFHYRDSFRLHP